MSRFVRLFYRSAERCFLTSLPSPSRFPPQYNFIRGIAVENLLLAVACVYVAALLVTRPAVAVTTAFMVICITVDILGFIWMTNPKV
jgi:hypothetical protein